MSIVFFVGGFEFFMSMFDVVKKMSSFAKNNKKGQLQVVGLVVGLMVAAILIAILGLQVGYPIILAASNTTSTVNASGSVVSTSFWGGASATDKAIVAYIPTLYLVALLMIVVGLVVGAVFVGYSKYKGN